MVVLFEVTRCSHACSFTVYVVACGVGWHMRMVIGVKTEVYETHACHRIQSCRCFVRWFIDKGAWSATNHTWGLAEALLQRRPRRVGSRVGPRAAPARSGMALSTWRSLAVRSPCSRNVASPFRSCPSYILQGDCIQLSCPVPSLKAVLVLSCPVLSCPAAVRSTRAYMCLSALAATSPLMSRTTCMVAPLPPSKQPRHVSCYFACEVVGMGMVLTAQAFTGADRCPTVS
jgi:hypothetical protein